MIHLEDLSEEELTLVRDILKHTVYALALLLACGVFFTGCAGCGVLVVAVAVV